MGSWLCYGPMNNSPFCCQSRSTWATAILAAWSTCWCSSVAQFLGMWASAWCTFISRFSTWAAISCHNTAAQMDLPLHWKLFCFHYCNHHQRAFAAIRESVQRENTGHFSCSVISKDKMTNRELVEDWNERMNGLCVSSFLQWCMGLGWDRVNFLLSKGYGSMLWICD